MLAYVPAVDFAHFYNLLIQLGASYSFPSPQAKPDLSYPDTVVGVALTEGGKPASISISLAAHQASVETQRGLALALILGGGVGDGVGMAEKGSSSD